MTYEAFSHFAGTWGLVLLVILFIASMGRSTKETSTHERKPAQR